MTGKKLTDWEKGIMMDMVGMFVSSKAGHDKTAIYIIIREEDEYVYLVDGKYRSMENPKRKNKKHIQLIKKFRDKNVTEKLIDHKPIYNEEIKKAIGGLYVENRCD